jgi:hypothetical protein
MNKYARQGRGVVAGLLLVLVLPATALAKAPTVSSGSATAVTQTTATVRGKVNPQGNVGVTAFFQYGTTKLYGATTPEIPLSAAKKALSASSALGNLTAFTTYHYRVVARQNNKYVFGSDRTFKTDRQPLGLTLAATPSSVRSGGATTLTGNLSGTGNAGQQVLLQQQAFGTTEFTASGNPQVVDASGNFSFPILDVFVNTAYKVVLPEKPEIVSPVVFVTVPLKVRMSATRTIRRGKRATFKGTVSPNSPGSLVEIQKRFHGTYVTIARTTVRSDGTHFRRRLKLKRGGTFRAQVTPGDAYVADVSGTHKVRVKRG